MQTSKKILLVFDKPYSDEEWKNSKFFEPLFSLVKTISRSSDIEFEFYQIGSDPRDSITKKFIEEKQQDFFDFVESWHPKIIVPFGKQAFTIMGLPDTRVSIIHSVPTISPFFGGLKIDCRTKKYKENTIENVDENRGYFIDNKRKLDLVSYSDIIVYPIFKKETYLSYHSASKALPLLERQIKQCISLVKKNHYIKYTYTAIDTIHLFKDKSQINDALDALKELKDAQCIAFDIETAWENTPKESWLDCYHSQASIPLIAIGNREKTFCFNTQEMPELVPDIKKILEDENIDKMGWNLRFDIDFCHEVWGVKVRGTISEGMTLLYLTDMGLSTISRGLMSLKKATALFLDVEYAGYQSTDCIDTAIKNGDGNYLVEHLDDYMGYCALDVHCTYKVVQQLWNNLDEARQTLALEDYNVLDKVLSEITRSGISIDAEYLQWINETLLSHIHDIETAIQEMVTAILAEKNEELKKSTFNPYSKAHIADLLINVMKMPPKKTDKGNISVDSKYLERYTGLPICKLLLDLNAFKKQHELIEGISNVATDDGKVHPKFHAKRTFSGRLSSSKPNVQQIPENKVIDTVVDKLCFEPEDIIANRPVWWDFEMHHNFENETTKIREFTPYIKKAFIPEVNNTFIYADYKQIEIYVLANYISTISKDDTLQKALISGMDIHSYTAALLYSTLENKDYSHDFIKEKKHSEPYKTWRQNAKSVIFSLIYGKGYQTFAKERELNEEDAKKIFDAFLVKIPGIQHYMKAMDYSAKKNKQISTYQGHQRHLSIFKYTQRNKKASNIALNHPIQGTAANIVLKVLVKLHEELKPFLGRVVLTVHDSIMIEVPAAFMEGAAIMMREIMEDYPSQIFPEFLKIPLRVDMSTGDNWQDQTTIILDEIRPKEVLTV